MHRRSFSTPVTHLIVPLLFFRMLVSAAGPGEHAGHNATAPADSLVTVDVEQESSAILLGSRSQTQKIREKATFDGLVFDDQGHVVFFVGEYRPSVEIGHLHVSVHTHDHKVYSAVPLGLDDRISLAVVRAALPLARPVDFSMASDSKHFTLASPVVTDQCPLLPACLLARTTQDWLPFSVLKVSGLEKAWGCPQHGTMLLDSQGRFSGFLMHLSPHRYNDKLAYAYILPAPLVATSASQIIGSQTSIPAGWMGVFLAEKEPRVEFVAPDSPADKAGVRPGDLILGIDGHKVRSKMELIQGIRFKGAQQKTLLDVRRGDADERLQVELGARNPKYAAAWAIEMDRKRSEMSPPTDQVRAELLSWTPLLDLGLVVYRVNQESTAPFPFHFRGGFLVKSIVPGSAAAKGGFERGDILFTINGIEVNTIQDLIEGSKVRPDGSLTIKFLRAGQVQTMRLRAER